jgi:AcrR family transcriptional regulator
MIAAAQRLLSVDGLDGTTFATVLQASGSPRGSVYYHFPDGKSQMIREAVAGVGSRVQASITEMEAGSPMQVVHEFSAPWRALLTSSGFEAGCAVAAVVPGDPGTSDAIFRGWRDALTEKFERCGLAQHSASGLSSTVLAGIEGALVLARASRSIEEFDQVVADLEELARIRGEKGLLTGRPAKPARKSAGTL